MFKRIISAAVLSALAGQANAERITVTIENAAAPGGTYLTPVWVGFHDGSFDLFDPGGFASLGLERVAEDGAFDDLAADFASVASGVDQIVTAPDGFPGAPVFDPGERASVTLDLDPSTNAYMNYAAMLLPSNDAFIGNAMPLRIFDEQGAFVGPISFVVYGSNVYDAGTEANTETDAAFFNQSAPDSGQATNDPIQLHPGFNGSIANPNGMPQIFLDGVGDPGISFDAVEADFSEFGFQVARITISSATEPYLVQVRNLSPAGGTFLTPTWVGFHDGVFDLYDRGAPVGPGVESLAEDGALDLLNSEFLAAVAGGVQSAAVDPAGFEPAPVIDAGGFVGQTVVELDSSINRFLSYASMVIPSNDAFIANGSPQAHEVFDADGTFLFPRFIVSNEEVLDAGTEENTEMDAAFLNQSAPNTGLDENGVVLSHPGFNGSFANPDGQPVNILGGTNGAGLSFDSVAADFTREGRQIAEISVTPLIDQSYSGSWFSPERSGEGLVLEVINNHPRQAVISFYTYTNDGLGDPLWTIGSGAVIGNTAFASLFVGRGASYGDAFDSGDVSLDPFGEVSVRFNTCTTGILTVTPIADGFEPISYPIERLSPLSIGQGNCRAQ